MTGIFNDAQMTIGVDFHTKALKIDRKNIRLQIWDFAGEERFRAILPGYINGIMGGIFMYDITHYSSIRHLDDWLGVYKKGLNGSNGVPLIMVGGKSDLRRQRSILREDALEMADKKDFSGFFECSAKTGDNVEYLFSCLAKMLLKNAE